MFLQFAVALDMFIATALTCVVHSNSVHLTVGST